MRMNQALSPFASEPAIPFKGLGDALERLLRPAVGFWRPDDVLKDPDLEVAEKRAILSSWASDACAVENRPDLRWLIGTPEPVPVRDVLEALARLDRTDLQIHQGEASGPADIAPCRRRALRAPPRPPPHIPGVPEPASRATCC